MTDEQSDMDSLDDGRYDRIDGDESMYPMVPDNPLNRSTAFALYHHTNFGSQEIRENIVTGLARIRDRYDDHSLAIGGDYGGRGGRTRHYVIKYDSDAGEYGEYIVSRAKSRGPRERFSTAGDVLSYMENEWPDESFTYVALLARSQTAFVYKERSESKDDDSNTSGPGPNIILAA